MAQEDWRKDYRKSVNEVGGEIGWTLAKIFTRIIIPVIILGVVLGMLGWGLGILGQPAKVIEKVVDADNILYNYEWFKQAHQDIKAMSVQIQNAQAAIDSFNQNAPPRKDWDYPTTTEFSRLNTILLGLRNQRQNQVATYNARSKMVSRNIFKTGDLPDHIE